MSDLERDLEAELHRVLDPLASRPVPARRPIVQHTGFRKIVGGAGAALTIKVLSGVAVAAAAVTVAGATSTGSLNPSVWGQKVQQQVQTCKDQLNQGQHGIGDCVSGFANQHGQAVASEARQHGNDNGNGHSNNGNNGHDNNGHGNNGQSNGNDSSHKPAPGPKDPSNDPKDPSSHAAPKATPGP